MPTLAGHNARRARTLVQERQYSCTAQALCSAGLAQPNRDTLRVMHAKHPFQVPPQLSEGQPERGPSILTPNEVFQSVKHFKAGSAPGPSGLRAEHLKEIGGRGQGRGMACLVALTGVLNKMSAGKMPEEAAPYFCGANLFTAIKKQGGIRPVAVGEVLRRLCYAVSPPRWPPTLQPTSRPFSSG